MRSKNVVFLSGVLIVAVLIVHLATKSQFLFSGKSICSDSHCICNNSLSEDGNPSEKPSGKTYQQKKLAVIVPFRDCFEELLVFAPHMKKFLNAQNIPHHIFVINQIDRYRFNRGSLINVGYLYTKSHYDYIVIHDVDLLPLNNQLNYSYPTNGVFHVASPDLHPKKKYEGYLGGILIVSNRDFRKAHGMSNDYWGWGLEDDEFSMDLMFNRVLINQPEGIRTGKNGTFIDIHNTNRVRDKSKCKTQGKQNLRRFKKAGVEWTQYDIKSVEDHTLNDAPITILNVELNCNLTRTPWCFCNP